MINLYFQQNLFLKKIKIDGSSLKLKLKPSETDFSSSSKLELITTVLEGTGLPSTNSAPQVTGLN